MNLIKNLLKKKKSSGSDGEQIQISEHKEQVNCLEKVTTAIQAQTTKNSKTTLSYAEKERITVEKICISDMFAFPKLPYKFDTVLKKNLAPTSHAFAYIDLKEHNREIAINSLCEIDKIIRKSPQLSSIIPKTIRIPVNDIIFEPIIGPYNNPYEYTKLICSPYTFAGKPSKHPASLRFMTDLSISENETHGELSYLSNGTIGEAKVCIWKNNKGYFYDLKIINEVLDIDKITSTEKLNNKNQPDIIYQA